MRNITENLDAYIVSVVHSYNNDGKDNLKAKVEVIKGLSGMYGNESRGKMKNEIDKLVEEIAGIPIGDSNKRVTNIDSFSAYMDRLATERIKEYNFKYKQNKDTEAYHQVNVVKVILNKINNLLNEINLQGGYNYIGEKRTFDEGKLIADVNQVVKQLKNDQL